MTFHTKEIKLKNGNSGTLRSPSVTEANQLLQYMQTVSGETEYLTRYSEEWNIPIEKEVAWIKYTNASPRALSISCYLEGKIAGNCNINLGNTIKSAHIATIGITVLRDYWNLGIGSAMLSELIEFAKIHRTEIIELEFAEGNDRAKKLYEKFGFRIVAEKPNALKLKNGTHMKIFYMQKYL